MGAVGRPRKYTPEELEAKIGEYFTKCEKHTVQVPTQKGDIVDVNKPRVPTIGGICIFLDITRETFNTWAEEELYSDIVKKAKDRLLLSKEDALVNGDGNTTGLIFYMKAKEGWKDKQTIEHEGSIDITLNLDN